MAPYGSVHHPGDPKKGQLWGDPSVWVRRFVKAHGLKLEGDAYDGIPDHIGHELELMAQLVAAELRARQAEDTAGAERLRGSQRALLFEQLLRWVPGFCQLVQDAAKLPFYDAVARLTVDLLDAERARLQPPSAEQPLVH